jgi:hypothetical protein
VVTGTQYWLSQLQAGLSRQQVAFGFVNSPEHRRQEVDSYYRTFLNRDAEADPLSPYWVGLLLGGSGEVAVLQGLLTSPEYTASHPDSASFARDLYFEGLGRAAADSEVAAVAAQLDGGASRADVLQAVLLSPESSDRAVAGYFASLLHRGVPAGNYWSLQLEAGAMNLGQVEAAILGDPSSHEFFDKVSGASS